MQVLVVDDEALARERCKRLVEGIPGYRVVGEAVDGQAALTAIDTFDPDIVLLDVRMPGSDGISTARQIAELSDPPAVIFCTAYNEYAVEAFETLAIGYILKPLKPESLAAALEKASKFNKVQKAALEQGDLDPNRRKNIAAKTRRGVELVAIDDVFCFQADQKYVTIMHKQGETLIDDTLKQLEKEFGSQFIRVHRNALVAIKYIERMERTASGQYELALKNQEFRPIVSRRHVAQVKEFLESL